MQNLNANESIKYVGGAKFTIGLVSALAFITSFIFGVIDGCKPQCLYKKV